MYALPALQDQTAQGIGVSVLVKEIFGTLEQMYVLKRKKSIKIFSLWIYDFS
jgi:hypothetical protein